jgi:hypothetical protein
MLRISHYLGIELTTFFSGSAGNRTRASGSVAKNIRDQIQGKRGSFKKFIPHAFQKVKLSLRLTKHYSMKAYGGSRCIDQRFLDLGTSMKWGYAVA